MRFGTNASVVHVQLSNLLGGMNPKIVQPFAGPKLCDHPAWLLPAASPSLWRPIRIPIFGQHTRVRASCFR